MGSNLESGVCFRFGCQAPNWIAVGALKDVRIMDILRSYLAEFPGRLITECGIKCKEWLQQF